MLVIIIAEMVFSYSDTAKALTISPPVIEADIDPGSVYEDVIKVFNETDREVAVYTSTSNFAAKDKEGEEGEPRFLAPEEKSGDLADWIEIEKGPILLRSQEKRTVPFKINVPASADPGGRYAAIFFGNKPSDIEGNAVVGLTGKLGSLVLLKINGDVAEDGEVFEFGLKDKKKFYEYMPEEFFFRFRNFGTVHLKPQGSLIIKDMAGRIYGEIEANKTNSGGNVLPGTTRRYDILRNKNPLEGFSGKNFWEKAMIEKDNFAFGRYEAVLDLSYGTEGKKIRSALFFWVFPWHLMLVSAIVIIVLVIALILAVKRYNRWIIKKAIDAGKTGSINFQQPVDKKQKI